MENLQTGSFQLMKKINKTLILDIIRQHGPISRAEIAKMTKLTPPTVTNLVRDLLSSCIIMEGERGDSTGGRKAIMLHINPHSYFAIGIDVGVSQITAVVTNLQGEILVHHQQRLEVIKGEQIIKIIIEMINNVIKESKLLKEKFIGIGIGMHGLVDSKTGTSIFAPHFDLRQVPIKHIIEDEFQISTYLDNDVRAMAIGESWYGHGQELGHFIFVNVGMGIGAGIVLNHQVYRGISESAGEIGHTTVLEDGPLCNCGNKGCLEVLAAGPGIVARAMQGLPHCPKSSLHLRLEENKMQLSSEIIYEEAVNGDPLALQIMEETGKYLGIGIANITNILNPELIVIGGGVANAGELLLDPLIRFAKHHALDTPGKIVQIKKSKLGDHSGAIGAATLVLQRIFKVDTMTE